MSPNHFIVAVCSVMAMAVMVLAYFFGRAKHEKGDPDLARELRERDENSAARDLAREVREINEEDSRR